MAPALSPLRFADLPGFDGDDFSTAFRAFLRSATALASGVAADARRRRAFGRAHRDRQRRADDSRGRRRNSAGFFLAAVPALSRASRQWRRGRLPDRLLRAAIARRADADARIFRARPVAPRRSCDLRRWRGAGLVRGRPVGRTALARRRVAPLSRTRRDRGGGRREASDPVAARRDRIVHGAGAGLGARRSRRGRRRAPRL